MLLGVLLLSKASLFSNSQNPLSPLQKSKQGHEVFGFAPYWNFGKLDSVDFSVLTTFSYFGIPVNADGSFDKENSGYTTFFSKNATNIFQKAHSFGTRVVVTLTQMDNSDIESFLDSPDAQKNMIGNAVSLVAKRGVDGINVDFEYVGDPGDSYRQKFSEFILNLTTAMHRQVASSKVTVSVYASSVKEPKLYNIGSLAKETDGIFMMAYDFATSTATATMPTAPLYGHKQGKYWYDVSTAVADFLSVMPANKLILGLPWYGYNYPVYKPGIESQTQQGYYTYYWYKWRKYYQYIAPPPSQAQTYSDAKENIKPDQVTSYTTGWDSLGKVNWIAYQQDGVWREIFLEDEKSLSIKYDFAKQENLAGVGIWALGFEKGYPQMWSLLSQKFGEKLADSAVINRAVSDSQNE